MLTQRFLVALLTISACAIPASATLTTCTTENCLSVPGDTFSNISFAAGSLGTSTTASGVVFSTNGAGLTGEANPTGWPAGSSEPALVSSEGVNTLTITLPSDVNAIEFAAGLMDFDQLQISITDNAGGSYTYGGLSQSNIQVPVYFGVSTTGSFSTFTIGSVNSIDQLTLDDIEIGQLGSEPDAAPEAATMLLVATGLFAIGYFRRRRVLRPAAA